MANFSYCMNVHPADNFKDLIKNLENYALPIAEKVKSSGVMGVELHLNHVVAEEVLTRINEFKAWLNNSKLQVFSINNYHKRKELITQLIAIRFYHTYYLMANRKALAL